MGDLAIIERRQEAQRQTDNRKARLQQNEEGYSSLGIGLGIDSDDFNYRRLTTGAKFHTRDLSPLGFERQLEVAWHLYEGNPFAHRLITLMTDLIIGEGVQVQVKADDQRIQAAVDSFISRNQFDKRLREFYIANSVSGELIFPVAVNPISGIPVIGYLDSCQVKGVLPSPENVLDLDQLVLKSTVTNEEQRLQIVRENPATRRLEGQVFFHRMNALPNSFRGRSDLMPLADWLDLYDQFMFSEVERLNLISAFAWDYTIEGAKSDEEIQKKVKALPKMKPGVVFGHNEKEKLEPRTPDLKASDRSEVARLLRVHIAGSMGFPISYLGEVDSNRATIEGQNDVLLKTPAARQREFARFLDQLIRFTVEQATGKNPVLFSGAAPEYMIVMPEIAAKDIARVGTVMASVVSAMDTGIANETVSKKLAIRVIAGLVSQLGIQADPQDIADEIEEEADDRQETADLLQQELARRAAKNPNPPVPADPEADPADSQD